MTVTVSPFIWHELMTSDVEGAKRFYGQVVGWGTQTSPPPNDFYTVFTAGNGRTAGVMATPAEVAARGVPPHWMGYVHVADTDAKAAQAQELGGSVVVPPTDIPSIGRFAVLSDPHGAKVAIMAPSGEPTPDCTPDPNATGLPSWNELMAGDLDSAFAFYAELFGWTKGEAVDLGPMGTYQMFAAGDRVIGGMMTKPPMLPYPFWNYYFSAGDIDAAADRVRSAGGEILMGPHEVPGGTWIVQGRDPQGAVFAVTGHKSGSAA